MITERPQTTLVHRRDCGGPYTILTEACTINDKVSVGDRACDVIEMNQGVKLAGVMGYAIETPTTIPSMSGSVVISISSSTPQVNIVVCISLLHVLVLLGQHEMILIQILTY